MTAKQNWTKLLLLLSFWAWKVYGFVPMPTTSTSNSVAAQVHRRHKLFSSTPTDNNNDNSVVHNGLPRMIVFDLDGCLWRPEMYELLYFSGGKGAPFTPSEMDPNTLKTVGGEPVYLLGDVRTVMKELCENPKWKHTRVGISSRTDAPDWARELLSKFKIDPTTVLQDVMDQSLEEISHESKVQHFRRLSKSTNISFEEMIFLDNEFGNCQDVSEFE